MKKILSLILVASLLSGCAPAAAPPVATDADPVIAEVIAEAAYPEMAPYPDESEFVDPVTGIFDDAGFSQVYDAWRGNRDLRQDIPQGYADNLRSWFQESIPVFLASSNGNAACSPANIYIALAVAAECTAGDSRQEILDRMGADSMESLRTQAQQVWKAHYCDDGASASILANSLWLCNGLNYDSETVNRLVEHYYASIFQGTPGSEEMNQALRDWINRQTNGLLEEQAANLELDPQMVLALASTIYYRAKWSNEFRAENNTEEPFHSPAGDRTATYMNRTLSYGPYYWGADFGAVSLGLEDGSQMWLILPDEGTTPADILASGHALDLALGGWLETENQKSLRVNLSLPKFDVAADIHLNEPLQELGIRSIFSAETADFTPILPDTPAWLDSAKHAARVKIDEEGVEAAAYTVMMMAGAAMPPEDEMDFVLDRPFLFVITSRDNLPLFAGIVNEP